MRRRGRGDDDAAAHEAEAHLVVLEFELGHVALFEDAEEPPEIVEVEVHGRRAPRGGPLSSEGDGKKEASSPWCRALEARTVLQGCDAAFAVARMWPTSATR